MFLLEHDAKELLAARGVPVPAGWLLEREDTIQRAALPRGPWMVKAQVATGGRGKAGLVRRAATLREIHEHASALFGKTVGGRPVAALRIEQAVTGAREAYIGIVLEPAAGALRVLASARGGVDVEQLARESLHDARCAASFEAAAATLERLARALPPEAAGAVAEAGASLARAFFELEAVLVEVNPLFVLGDGRWLAGDAKIVTDDNALARREELRALLARRARAYPEAAFKLEHGFDYVVVDEEGEVGLLTTGAGLSMMLIDELRAAGLRPYNFLDLRTGGLRGESARLAEALRRIARGRKVRVLLVNIFAGITDLGEFARLLLDALAQVPQLSAPVVARLVGNGLPAAREVLAAAGIALHADLDEAIAQVRWQLARAATRTGSRNER